MMMRGTKLLTILVLLWSGGVQAHACLDWEKSIEKINSKENNYSVLGLTSKSIENFLIKKEGNTLYQIEGEKSESTTLKEAKSDLKLLFLEFYFQISDNDCLEIEKEIEKSSSPTTKIKISHPKSGVVISELFRDHKIETRIIVSCICDFAYRRASLKKRLRNHD